MVRGGGGIAYCWGWATKSFW